MPQATRLAAAISTALGAQAQLIKGGNGVFDVAVDGKPIFSKDREGRFPLDDEIVDAIRNLS